MRTVTLGYDGSPESRAAADWAAKEALRGGQALKVVFAWEWQPYRLTLMDAQTERRWVETLPLRAAAELARRYRGLEVAGERVAGPPAEGLLAAASQSDMLVLGSRALGGVHGFLIGSVAQSVTSHSALPVALVRATPHEAGDAETAGRASSSTDEEVVLGVDDSGDNDDLFSLSFEAAARRGQLLRVVHCWRPPAPAVADAVMPHDRKAALAREKSEWLDATVRPWCGKYPDVRVLQDTCAGHPAEHLTRLSHRASLLLVGRRSRRERIGPRIGHVAHAVMHHAAAPVIVVPEH